MNIILTQDSSPTLYSDTYGQTYHSSFGAEQESLLVFIQNGFLAYRQSIQQVSTSSGHIHNTPIRIMECGLGTGLNAALTWEKADELAQPCIYLCCEKYPPEAHVLHEYAKSSRLKTSLNAITNAPWGIPTKLSPYFSILKLEHDFTLPLSANPAIDPVISIPTANNAFDVVYYDAFSPEAQPELWTATQIARICSLLHSGNPAGIFCTYCSKGIVKTALRQAGMKVNRLPGPPGKRHVLQAIVLDSIEAQNR